MKFSIKPLSESDIPDKRGGGPGGNRYSFSAAIRELKRDESIFVEREDQNTLSLQFKRVAATAYSVARKAGIKVTLVQDENKDGVWIVRRDAEIYEDGAHKDTIA